MQRRILVMLLLAGLVVLAGGVSPWTVSSDRLRSAISAQLRNTYGFELSAGGRSTIALLPVPRLSFEQIALATPDGTPVVRGGSLKGELRIVPLLAGRLELAELALTGAAINVEVDEAGHTPWDTAVVKLRERSEALARSGHVKRIILKAADLQLRDRRSHFETVLRDIDLDATWTAADGALGLAGSMTWHGEPVEFSAAATRPAALAAGKSTRIALDVKAPLVRISANGDMSWPNVPRFVGRTSVETRSMRDFARWSGLDLPLASLMQAFALEGDVTAEGSDLSWPTARINLAGDKLEGALSSRHESGRRAITGTLAADRLDLTTFAMPLLQPGSQAGGWTPDAAGGSDLDLRFSASSARIGLLRMQDLAANISLKPGRYEASVGRVTINKGIVKGRATLARAADGLEVKGQSSFERVDLGSFLSDLGIQRWIGGLAQGQFMLEGSGDNPAEIVRRLHGRASISVRQGELADPKLTEALRRIDGKSAAALAAGRSNRTPFEEAHLRMTVADGMAEVSEGGLAASGLRAGIHGHASLPDRRVALKAVVEGSAPSMPIALNVTGPWDNVTIVPDVAMGTAPAAAIQ